MITQYHFQTTGTGRPKFDYNSGLTPQNRLKWLSTALVVAGGCGLSLAAFLYARAGSGDCAARLARCGLFWCEQEAFAECVDRSRTETVAAALRRNPGSGFLWADMADAYAKSGSREQAWKCYERAMELAPAVPAVLMRAATFQFVYGEPRNALPYTKAVLSLVRGYDGAVFSSYDRMGLTTSDVLKEGLPATKEAAQAYLSHLISTRNVEGAIQAWSWARHNSVDDDKLAASYVEFLLAEGRGREAIKTWGAQLGDRRGGYGVSTWIYNGDFEREFSGSALDWRSYPIDHVRVQRAAGEGRNGSSSLRIAFDGKANVDYRHTSQRTWLAPGPHRLVAWVRSEGVTTDQGLILRVADAEAPARFSVATEPILGTRPWSRIELPFTVPPDTRQLIVQFARRPSKKFDNKIRGTVWIDDVAIVSAR